MVVAVLGGNLAVVMARGPASGATTQLTTMRATPSTTEALSVADSAVVPVVVDPASAAPPPSAPVRLVHSNVGSDERPHTNVPDKAPVPKPAPARGPIVGAASGSDIEGYARYEPQTTCDPTPKPGTLALRNLLLSRYPNTVSFGISIANNMGFSVVKEFLPDLGRVIIKKRKNR